MGRGGIGGGGGHSSSSHSSSSHSVSGHRTSSGSHGSGSRGGLSSSSRPSFSSTPSYSRPPTPPPPRRTPPPPPPRRNPPPPPPHRSYSRPTSYGGSYSRTSSSGTSVVTVIAFVIIVIVIAVIMVSMSGGCVGGTFSTVKHQGLGKTAIQPLSTYRADCVVDGDDWFVSPADVGRQLKPFYDKTGIQPWVVIKSANSGLVTDKQKEDWADGYYKEYIPHEGALLYVYFAESNPDIEGYSVLIGGAATKSFFDSLATDVFWDVYDANYYNTKLTEEEFIVKTFLDTAEICLTDKEVSTEVSTGIIGVMAKAVPILIIGIFVVIALCIVVKIQKAKHARKAAEAAETERILNTPLDKLGSDDDSLINKYK